MPSKSNPPKPIHEWRVKQPTRNWLDLPSDLTLNILQRVGVIDRLLNAQLVCTAWREICKDPAMWRVVYMDGFNERDRMMRYSKICKLAVNRSQGQLVDLTTVGFSDHNLLRYVANRSRKLRRLEFVLPSRTTSRTTKHWSEIFKNSPLLEELSLVSASIWIKDIEAAGRYCPLLKTLKVNVKVNLKAKIWNNDVRALIQNGLPLAIGKSLPGLTHLELIGNGMTNIGLQAILDGCCHLESLDLRRCLGVDIKGELGKRCSQHIKYLKLPDDSLEGHPYRYVLDA